MHELNARVLCVKLFRISNSHDALWFWHGRHIGTWTITTILILHVQFKNKISEHFKLLRQLLALSGETFEEELRHLVITNFFTNAMLLSNNCGWLHSELIHSIPGFQYSSIRTHGGIICSPTHWIQVRKGVHKRGVRHRHCWTTHAPQGFWSRTNSKPRTMSFYSPTFRELAGFDFPRVLQCNQQLITSFPFGRKHVWPKPQTTDPLLISRFYCALLLHTCRLANPNSGY